MPCAAQRPIRCARCSPPTAPPIKPSTHRCAAAARRAEARPRGSRHRPCPSRDMRVPFDAARFHGSPARMLPPMPDVSHTLFLAAPRGFCAGVDRAIDIVDMALQVYGAPVYVRHEIVHNRHVVEDLRRKGAVFTDDLADVPHGAVVIFSAHGVSPAVRSEARERGLRALDATCPLVTKVHLEALKYARDGYSI